MATQVLDGDADAVLTLTRTTTALDPVLVLTRAINSFSATGSTLGYEMTVTGVPRSIVGPQPYRYAVRTTGQLWPRSYQGLGQ